MCCFCYIKTGIGWQLHKIQSNNANFSHKGGIFTILAYNEVFILIKWFTISCFRYICTTYTVVIMKTWFKGDIFQKSLRYFYYYQDFSLKCVVYSYKTVYNILFPLYLHNLYGCNHKKHGSKTIFFYIIAIFLLI